MTAEQAWLELIVGLRSPWVAAAMEPLGIVAAAMGLVWLLWRRFRRRSRRNDRLERRSWHRRLRRSVVLAALTGAAAGLAHAGLLGYVNELLQQSPEFLQRHLHAFAAVAGLALVTRAGALLLTLRVAQGAVYALRVELSRDILAAPLARLQRLGGPRLLAVLTEDVSALTEASAFLPALFINGATLLGCWAYMAWLSPRLLLMLLGVVGLGWLGYVALERLALRALRSGREHEDAMYRLFRGLTDGIKELKLNRGRREAFLRGALEPTAAASRASYVRGFSHYVWGTVWGTGLFYLALGYVLFLPLLEAGAAGTVRGGFVLVMLYLLTPLYHLAEALPVLGRAQVALGKIGALTDELPPPRSETPATATSLGQRPRELELRGVSHRYPAPDGAGFFTLGPLDLNLHPGEVVYIVGGNGSGKTTLALLLVGLYAPSQGQIRVDGQVVDESQRDAYRQLFSAVFSDFYLFDSLLGFEAAELDARAREYLRQLQLDHKVEIQNGRFSTLDLSQGQRKRLALLVAYLEDRSYFLFDEWASDQDPEFKAIFYTEILPALRARGKTVVVISHDDSYFDYADRLVRLERGRIAEILVPQARQSRPVVSTEAQDELFEVIHELRGRADCNRV